MATEQVYLNGKLCGADEARVPVANPSFLHGAGLFETLRAYKGKPFRLREHIDRLAASAKRLNMPIGDAAERIGDAVQQVLQANGLKNARIRVTVTPSSPHDADAKPTLLVRAEETVGYPTELYEKGMTVCVLNEYRQSRHDPLAGHKTTSYFGRLVALRDAQDRHCGEGLWFTAENLLAEGCISNVFLVKAGRLRTPPPGTPVLPGVTRATVLELAAAAGIAVDEGPCTIDDLLNADEVFLTNAVMEVMPAARIERHAIGQERPGPVTIQLLTAYRQLVASSTA